MSADFKSESAGEGGADEESPSSSVQDKTVACDCRTKALATDISECLMNRPRCEHALSFGYSFLCKHPLHREFRKK